MAYVFPDQGLEQVIDQFMLGDRLLVAPVLEKGAASRSVRGFSILYCSRSPPYIIQLLRRFPRL